MPALAIAGIPIALLAAALVGLLFLLATPTIEAFIGGALSRIPVVGGALSGIISTALNTISASVSAVIDDQLRGLGEWFWALGSGLWTFESQVVGHLSTLTTAAFTLTTDIANAYQNAIGVIQDYYNQAIAHANTLYNDAVGITQNYYNQAIAHANTLYNDAVGITQDYYNQAIAYTNTMYNDAVGITQDYYNQAIAFVNSQAAGLLGDIENYYNLAISAVNAARSDLLGDIQNYYNLAIAYINQEIGAVNNAIDSLATRVGVDLSNTLAQAEQFTAAAANALGSEITSVADRAAAAAAAAEAAAVTTAEGAATDALRSAIDAIEATITPDVVGPWDVLLPALVTVEGAIGADAAAALGLGEAIATTDPSTVAGVLDVVVPALGAIAVEVAECSVPMCTNLGGLSSLFGELLSGLELAGVVAFLAEAASNPAGAIDDVDDIVAGPVNDVASAFRSLVGV
jgi:hypothetical protein